MKLLRRNMTQFEYLAYTGTDTDLNEFGEHTGELHPQHNEPIPYMGNISVPSGQTNQTFYGEDIRYTHTLVMDDPNVDIRVHGLIAWNEETYEIMAVRPSLNVLSIALRKQTADHSEEEPEPEPDEPGEDEPEEPEPPEELDDSEPGGEPDGDDG